MEKPKFEDVPQTVAALKVEQAEIKEMLASLLGQKTMAKKPLTAKQACEWLSLSMPTLLTLVKRGEIKAMRIRNQHRFLVDDLIISLQNKNYKNGK